MSTALLKIAAKAKQDPHTRFTSLAHVLTPEFLRETWGQLNRKGASGIDGETIGQFATNLDERIQALWQRLKAGQYQAPPVRRVEIPKGNGTMRPLGIPTLQADCTSFQVFFRKHYGSESHPPPVWPHAPTSQYPPGGRSTRIHRGAP